MNSSSALEYVTKRKRGSTDQSGITSQCGGPEKKVARAPEFVIVRDLTPDHWLNHAPGFMECSVDNDCVGIQAPDKIRDPDSEIACRLVHRGVSGWILSRR